jgi:tetratricopeptide (TPR) repeat protein
MRGNFLESKQAADKLAAHVKPMLKDMPMLEGFMTIPTAVLVRFEKWNEVMKLPKPAAEMKVATVFWHYARAMALAGSGKADEAEKDHLVIVAAREATPEDAIFAPPFNNKTKNILQIADDVVAAKIAMARKDHATAITRLQNAVAVQDSLNYGEPPDWYFPVREMLGGVLLMNGKADEAEKVFRADLERNPRNPRSLFGLRESLKQQKRDYDAHFVDREFRSAWKGGVAQLKLEDLV